ncbi:MAG: FAD-binding oxidoreductase [Flavobacteriales bacterium]|jgi:gamma-glutamylputrescine oxidase|nr:FAD-binding oxidoreductase [Flavobacteriales bacterium]MBT3963401.1 FAD-binding oxidoreductase [Flavobacteriales bacterium]MBT4704252.1 FAD-binding oxidoreductase [Flavobacteriales bacterium]MBT4930592.1 FAD-binding oxidoreductase [Flavobacteriales bacterium]MBT5131867.1 FAD-binding oxidoreductase [Flavobacteriales bacterium]
MQSFWEKDLTHYEVAIVGAGIVGLSIAASLIEKNIKNILILDRSVIPYGASTRNAGFACYGSLTEVLSDIKTMGADNARELLFNRWMGLQITRKRLGEAGMEYESLGGYELLENQVEARLDQMDAVNQLVSDFLPGYLRDADDLKSELGIHSDGRLISIDQEAQLNPALLLRSLEQYVTENGATIRTGSHVKSLNDINDKIQIEVKDGSRKMITFSAGKVVVAVNGFAEELIGNDLVKPGRGQVFITKPIPELKFKGNLHIEEGYYYFRNVGNRLLIGGARNFDFQNEETTEIELNDKIQSHLEHKSQEIFQLGDSFAVEMRWSGIMAFGNDKTPLVQRSGNNMYLALRMGGMGVALAGTIGEEVAEMIEEDGL